jgi:putative SOS response-associated peptidase YedK
MALRLVIPSRSEVESELAVDHPWWRFSVSFNVSIPQSVPVARMHERECEGVMMRWGLALKSARGEINLTTRGVVRGDSLQADPDLRTAWVYGQRAIVPVAGFYLWQHSAAGHRQPYYVRLVNRPVFGIAAVWERSETNDGEVLESCALVAVDANPLLAEVDNITAQMPGILRSQDYGPWLNGKVSQAQQLLEPYPQTQMLCHPVGPRVNHAEFDEPGLIQPTSLAEQPRAKYSK